MKKGKTKPSAMQFATTLHELKKMEKTSKKNEGKTLHEAGKKHISKGGNALDANNIDSSIY